MQLMKLCIRTCQSAIDSAIAESVRFARLADAPQAKRVSYETAELIVRCQYRHTTVREARRILRAIKSGAIRPVLLSGNRALTVDYLGLWTIVSDWN